jgi:hypothetical protein
MDELARFCGLEVALGDTQTEAETWPRGSRWQIRVHRSVSRQRARWLVGHELAEWWLGDALFSSLVERERVCDAIGAALVAPAPEFARAIVALDHSVTALAQAFDVPVSLALLRIGEVTGRPVRLLGPRPRERGQPREDWTTGVHPVRLAGEARWGLMECR